ncbi:MAG TPA: hypothetical protein DHV53_10560, partial [Gammaproteobacteria bacterium]|nr:hypothetical protein [Gammaproteobacteria bacterium]
ALDLALDGRTDSGSAAKLHRGLFWLGFLSLISPRHRWNTAFCSLIYLAARSSAYKIGCLPG